MNQTQNPGVPQTDELARNAAYNTIRLAHVDATGPHGDGQTDCERMARYMVDEHTVTWERDINSAGVAVRRYVLRGAWEVDPENRVSRTSPSAGGHVLRARDVVRFADRRDGGREWTVQSTENWLGTDIISMTAPGADEVAEQQYARADELELLQRTVQPGEPLITGDMAPGVLYKMPSGDRSVMVDDPAQGEALSTLAAGDTEPGSGYRKPAMSAAAAAEDELTPAQHRRVADELGNARREGYAEALRAAYQAVRENGEDPRSAVHAVAGQLGVTL